MPSSLCGEQALFSQQIPQKKQRWKRLKHCLPPHSSRQTETQTELATCRASGIGALADRDHDGCGG